MRVNVYAEEITDEVEVVTKTAVIDGEERTFYGLVYLPEGVELWTKAGGTDASTLSSLLHEMLDALDHGRVSG